MEIPPKFEIKFNRRERGARRDNQDKIQIKKPQAKLLATEGTEITEPQIESSFNPLPRGRGEGWVRGSAQRKRRSKN
jgi:hypothetical protein